ncbi:MAG: outer membrane lipoprotein LolB [Pseudomonadota bacterium]
MKCSSVAAIIAEKHLSRSAKSLFLIVIYSTLIATGCVSRAPTGDETQFLAAGKLGVRTPDGAQSMNFRWEQRPEGFEVTVWGVLGQGRTTLRGNAQRLQIRRGDQLLAEGAPDRVMSEALGWSLPVDLFAGWLRGQPLERDLSVLAMDELGRMTAIEQAQWQITFSRFAPRDAADARPRLIKGTDGVRRVTISVRELSDQTTTGR